MLPNGTTIAGYRIDGVLGSGGMGVVYEATQLSLQRTVALKVLASHLSSDESFCERFRREAMLQAALDHPHIVPVHEAGESDQGLFLAMRLVRGSDLKRLVPEGGIAAERALAILTQVASALDAAHEAGLIHRDIKPQNILVEESGRAYLADFGLIKGAGERGLTRTGQYLGSLDYVSPEQIKHKPMSARSDLYAFAAVLFEALSGEVPFPRDTEAAILFAHLSDPPPRLAEGDAELPSALDAVIGKGLAKEPEDRYASATELVEAARAAINGGSFQQADRAEAALPAADPRGRFGQTIVDPAILREAPAVLVERARRRLPPRVLWGMVALVPLLAIAGFLAGRSHDRTEAVTTGVAVAGPLTLVFPTDWRLVREADSISGLRLNNRIVLREEALQGELRAGIAPGAEGPRALPAAFLRQLARAPEAETVRLDRLPALRYQGLRHREAGPMNLYVVPTDRGAATIACLGSSDALERCEAIATTLSLRSAEARELGPSERYGSALRAVFRRLDRARTSTRRRLADASNQRGQARAARQLAAAFRQATGAVEKARPGLVARPSHRALQTALDSAAAAYGALAVAARNGDAVAYGRAIANVRGAEDAVRDALSSLTRLGYRITLGS